MKNKLILSIVFVGVLIVFSGCGLKVGNIDVGRLASATADVVTGGKLSLAEQQGIGEQMTAIIIGSSKLHPNARLQTYVNQVGSWIALHANLPEEKNNKIEWQFIVIDTPDFNAFSMPGGYVIISSGAIDRLSSEAELAAVLAHEIVHVEQNHQVAAIEKSKQFSGLGDIAFIAADYSKARDGGYNESTARNRQIAKGLFNVTHELYTKGLSRDDELDADQKAVVLMTRAGYDPYAYISVLQIIESMNENKKMLLLATHPKPVERIEVASSSVNYVEKFSKESKVMTKRFISQIQ